MDFELWVLDIGLLILEFGMWMQTQQLGECGVRGLGFELWDLGFQTYVFGFGVQDFVI